MTATLPIAAFTCAYEPATALLCGSWAGPVPAAALPACYGQLLAVAQAHGACRFWLLDMRGRDWHDVAFAEWFSTEFAARASAAVGVPLFIACVVQPGQRPQVEDPRTGRLLQRAAARNLFPFYFTDELLARAWLLDQQAAEWPPRARPARMVLAC